MSLMWILDQFFDTGRSSRLENLETHNNVQDGIAGRHRVSLQRHDYLTVLTNSIRRPRGRLKESANVAALGRLLPDIYPSAS